MHKDYGRPERQAFLRQLRPLIGDGIVGHVITAALAGSLVIAFLGGRYVG